MLTKVEQLLLELLQIPSETGEEGKVLKFLEEKVAKLIPGIQITKIPVAENRYNILFTKDSTTQIQRLFLAHVDTVPGQLDVTHDEQNIYGRGACDNKHSAAAMLIALQELIDAGETGIGMLCTVGEESTFDGAESAQKYLEENNIKLDLAIIGEPTQGEIVTAQKGILAAKISCTGKQEHSSSTNINSAIHKLISVLSYVQNNFDNKNSIMNIGLIEGGVAENIVAGEASATIVWRTDEVDFKDRVLELLQKAPQEIQQVNAELMILKNIPPKSSDLEQFEKNEVNYFSEMFFFENSIVCGAGSIEFAHTKHEHINREQLNNIVQKYKELILT